ncbi:MAG: nitronate monooxygenase [Myxococcales bacterium]|nr:nitronate monooxygenase [Myxococcales bacterium]
MSRLDTVFTRQAGIEVPIICGAMYPCSNLELIAAVSAAGGIGVVQPISLIFAHKTDLREGLRKIRSITPNPIGFNAIVEKSSSIYEDRMRKWVDIALEEGIRFFVTALGNPRWVVEKVHAVGGIVYHDVTERKWAERALESGVDGLICVNNRAGGHAGKLSPEALYQSLATLGVPLICAGGIGGDQEFVKALELGYAGVQLGTRFIATDECTAHNDYKQAILRAQEKDIVLTDKISGVPVSIIKTADVEKMGVKAGFIARQLLKNPRTKHYMRMVYSLRSIWQLKKSNRDGLGYKDYFQAGKSVATISKVEPAGTIVRRFAEAAAELGQ